MCQGVPEFRLKQCFLSQRKTFIWENRDFNVEPSAILRYVEDFVLFQRERERTCEELRDNTLDDRFVMYNVMCSKPRFWHPAITDGGQKDCVFGPNYPLDHTGARRKDQFLFDTREECCSAYSGVCASENRSAKDEKEVHSSSGNALAVWHNYHKTEEQE